MDRFADPTWRRWEEVNRLFEAALDVPESSRAGFVADACGDDTELRDAVTALLRAESDSAGMFERLDSAMATAALGVAPRGAGGEDEIGPYRVLEELGRGGMGTIYLAERAGADFRQRVAIKMLRRGLDTEDIIRRFRSERRILADLDHPNIARLIDGGSTAGGQPYLVMEYVEGTAVTAFCEAGSLSVRQRLRLFLDVADAVRYAHTKLVVHRDLKPSNIMVTPQGKVKLLDFGIAKLLGADADGSERTLTRYQILTPEYASPEQLRGDPVTTGSDVYQLGVLLYVLLTGVKPFADDAATRLTGAEPRVRPPSAAARAPRTRSALRGDLDTIILKAMQHEPARRYDSVERLADDVRRHLEGRPVSARPDTLLYRTGKFLRRNRWAMPVAAIAVVLAGAYLVMSTRHARALERERNLAREEAERSQDVQRFLVDLFRSADPYAPADPERGRAITVVEAMDLGAERVTVELADRPRVQASLLETVARVYVHLGQETRAVPLAERALALSDSLFGTGSPEYRSALGTLAAAESGDSSLTLLRRRVELATQARGRLDPEVISARVALAWRLFGENDVLVVKEELDALVALADSADVAAADMAALTLRLADLKVRLGQPRDAEGHARRSLELNRHIYGDRSPQAANAHETLAKVLGALKRYSEAEAEFNRAIDLFTHALGEDNPNTLGTINNLALMHKESGALQQAEREFRTLLERRIRIHGPSHVSVGSTYQNLGAILMDLGRTGDAAAAHATAADIYDAVLAPDIYLRGLPHLSLARIRLESGDHAEAQSSARRALDALERSLPPDHYMTAVARCRVGRALAGAGRLAEAAPHLAAGAAVLNDSETGAAYRDECLPVGPEHTATAH